MNRHAWYESERGPVRKQLQASGGMSNTYTIAEFCDKFAACREGREWALSTGCTTMAELWQRDDIRPEWRIWIATRPRVMFDRDLRLFACWCVRQVWHLLAERSRNTVEVVERYAIGEATDAELAAASADASADACASAWAAACASAWAAAKASAWAAGWAAMAAGDAMDARDAAWAAQSAQLKTYEVNFEKGGAE